MAARRNVPRTPEGAWYRDYAEFKPEFADRYYPPEANDDYYFIRNKLPYGAGYDPGKMMTDRSALYDPGQRAYDPRNEGGRPPLFDPAERQDRDRYNNQQRDIDRYVMDQQRQDGPRYNDYPSGRQADGDRDWVPPPQFSPRRTSADPNFHRAAGEGRRTPPWERNRGQEEVNRGQGDANRGQGDVRGQVQYDDQVQRYTYDRQFTPRMTRAEQLATTRPAGEAPRKRVGAYLFIRFRRQGGEVVDRVAHACIRAKTSDMGGRFVGIARQVYNFGRDSKDDGFAVFQFPNIDQAENFFVRDKLIKQQDFPEPQGNSEIFVVSLQKDPNTMQLFDTFLLSEITLKDTTLEEYLEKFVEPFTSLLLEKGAIPYAAFSKSREDRKSLRRYFVPNGTILTLHLFQGPRHLEEAMQDRRYSQLRAIHNAIATETCSLFTVDPHACP